MTSPVEKRYLSRRRTLRGAVLESRMPLLTRPLAAAFLLGLLPLAAAAERPAHPPRRLALARRVTGLDSSPDGRTAFFAADITGAAELWSVGADGGWPLQLTDLGGRVSEPSVSPDGKSVLFALGDGGDGPSDLFLVPAEGGEAVNLTLSSRAETSPAWSPDGSRIAFLGEDGARSPRRLFARDLRSGEELRLTGETEDVRFPLWSPDGRLIAVTRSGDGRSGPLLLCAAGGSGCRVIPPPVRSGILIAQDWSPDGRQLLALAEDPEGFRRLFVLDPAGGTGVFAGPGGWDIEQARWKEGGIVFSRNESGQSALYRLRRFGAAPEALLPAAGRIERHALDAAGAHLLYVWSDSAHAPEVWRLDLRTGLKTRLTHCAPPGLPDDLSRGRVINYPSFDGRRIRAVYIKPRAPLLGLPPPLVVLVHGGPDRQSFDEFDPLRQSLAEAGFAVLAPNFRGSAGFGRRFLEANRKDWGGGDLKDLIAGVRHLAAKGEADARRVGIAGASFGGYMTLYALARNEGDWAAGVAAFAIPDLALDHGLSRSRSPGWYAAQMGDPAQDGALFRERSPIAHLEGLKAPLLLFGGGGDRDVPEALMRLLHDRLEALGRAPGLVVYADEGHGFTRRGNLADHYERTVSFLREKLGGPALAK